MAIHKSRREAWAKSFPPHPQKEPTLLTSDPGLLAPDLRDNLFLLFEPPSLQHRVMAALAN